MKEFYKKVKSSDYCLSIFDGTHDSPKYQSTGFPLVTSKCIINSKIDTSEASFISKEDYDLVNKRSAVKQFDILISMIGINAGIVGLIEEQPKYAIKNVGVFRCKSELDARYLFYYLQSEIGRYNLRSSMAGSAQPYISLEQLRTMLFDVPNEPLKQHIVNTIGTVDDLIEKNIKIIDKLEQLSRLIYLKHKNHRDGNLLLGDCCDIKTGKLDANACSKDGPYPFFTCGQEILKIDNYAFDCEAIIISGNGEISAKYFKGKFNAYQRTYVLSPSKLFYLFMEECKLSIFDLKNNSQGSVIKFITKGMLENIAVVNDTDSIHINSRLCELYKQITNIKKELDILKNIKTKLLNKYF